MAMLCDSITPAAALLSTGRSERKTVPALVSKFRLPMLRLAMVVLPVRASVVKYPLPCSPTESTPVLLTVRNVVVVALVDDAMAKRVVVASPACACTERKA